MVQTKTVECETMTLVSSSKSLCRESKAILPSRISMTPLLSSKVSLGKTYQQQIAFGFLGTRLVVSFLNRAISSINHLFAIKNPLANQIIMTTLDMMGRRSTYNLPSRCLNLCSVRLLYTLLLHSRALD